MKNFTLTRFVLLVILTVLQTSSMKGQGLEQIIVEKYYVANATDAADTEGGTLANGAVTYRIFVDMAPGFKFLAVYGVKASPSIFQPAHVLRLATTTTFFNNSDRGKETAEKIGSNRVDDNTTALDSWLSVGGSSGGHIGVLKADDTDGSILGVDGLLTNADLYSGIPLTTADGFVTGTPRSTNWLATGADLTTLFGESAGNTGPVIEITDGSWSSLEGSQGITDENYVLIGQFTTDGIFSYELNILIKDENNQAEKYVARNPGLQQEERLFPMLMNTLGKDLKAPSIEIISPANGALLPLDFDLEMGVNVSDVDGGIDSVEYIMDGMKIGSSDSEPFDIIWKTVAGIHKITAVATDEDGVRSVSEEIEITVVENSNVMPSVTISSPASGSYFIMDETVILTADATDTDGDIILVEFLVDDIVVGSDDGAPYTYDWIATEGVYSFTARATDNFQGTAVSDPVIVTVSANEPPNVSITSPEEGFIAALGDQVSVTAEPTDSDGEITGVEFFVNGSSLAVVEASPYTVEWTSVAGTTRIIAVATDDAGATDADTVDILVNVPPTIQFLTPAEGDTINTGDPVNVTVDARDPDGSVTFVEFFLDNELVASDGDKPFEFEWTTTEGSHEINVRAFDNHNAIASDTVSVVVMMLNHSPGHIGSASAIHLYPNPARAQIVLEFQGTREYSKAIIQVVSITGSMLLESRENGIGQNRSFAIDIESLSSGLYFLKVQAGNDVFIRQFVKD